MATVIPSQVSGQILRHFPEYYKLSEVREDGFFLRKNPIRRMVLVYTFPENALACTLAPALAFALAFAFTLAFAFQVGLPEGNLLLPLLLLLHLLF